MTEICEREINNDKSNSSFNEMNKKYLPAMYSTKKTVTSRKSKGVDLADQGMCGLVHPLLKKLGLDLVFQSVRPVNNLQYISKLVKKAVFQ